MSCPSVPALSEVEGSSRQSRVGVSSGAVMAERRVRTFQRPDVEQLVLMGVGCMKRQKDEQMRFMVAISACGLRVKVWCA